MREAVHFHNPQERRLVISLKKYLDSDPALIHATEVESQPEEDSIWLPLYRAILARAGECGEDICPDLGGELKSSIARIDQELSTHPDPHALKQIGMRVEEVLDEWSKKTARHYLDKAAEVRDLLLVMSRTAESLGHSDERYANQLHSVGTQLESIASLGDVSRMRASLEASARQLKESVDRMSAENRAMINHMRVEVMTCQAKLEKADRLAACDTLTGLGSRVWIEARIQERIDTESSFCVLMINIDDFRRVNDDFGHMVGDLLLKEFARELRSSCRVSNLAARWCGDTFLVVIDSSEKQAMEQGARLQTWLGRDYLIPGRARNANVRLSASIGCAAFREGDTAEAVLERADAALCASRQSIARRRTA